MTSIGNEAFSNCSSLTEVEIPNSVSNIGSGAFAGCLKLSEVKMPNSVASIQYPWPLFELLLVDFLMVFLKFCELLCEFSLIF